MPTSADPEMLAAEKAALRALLKGAREREAAQLPKAGMALAGRFPEELLPESGQVISAYVPFGAEIEPGGILSRASAKGATLALPVVVKKGEHGAILFADGDDPYVQPTVLLESVVDPTGAGDAFAGGFLGHVARAGNAEARTLRQAMVQGTVTASFTAESFGPDRLVSLSEDGIHGRRGVLARISAWPFD